MAARTGTALTALPSDRVVRVDPDLQLTVPHVRVEPGEWRVRRTGMRTLRTGAVLLAVVLLAAACGRQTGSASPYAGCVSRGTVVARADLDADGSTEAVRLVRAGSGRCADSLVTQVDHAVAGVSVRGLDLVPRGAKVVHLTGNRAPDLVLVSSRQHPRGGFQPHLFTTGGGQLREVTAEGHPVLPFVATDGGAAPMTARCTARGGIAVITGQASKPPGIVLAWDLTRTTYAVRNGRAVETGSAVVRKAVADPLLRKEVPGLFDGSLFTNCS